MKVPRRVERRWLRGGLAWYGKPSPIYVWKRGFALLGCEELRGERNEAPRGDLRGTGERERARHTARRKGRRRIGADDVTDG